LPSLPVFLWRHGGHLNWLYCHCLQSSLVCFIFVISVALVNLFVLYRSVIHVLCCSCCHLSVSYFVLPHQLFNGKWFPLCLLLFSSQFLSHGSLGLCPCGLHGYSSIFRSWLTSGVAHVDIMLSILTSTPKRFTIIGLGTPGHEGA
jgi:hypothetical protein